MARSLEPFASGRRSSILAWLALTGLLLLVFAAYQSVLSAGFIWDDDTYVFRNPLLTTAAGLRRMWTDPSASPQYYPMVFTTFWLEYHAWGVSPAGYHFVNILLHALNAVLAWRVLRRLGVPGAWWAAAIFAVHPVHVESVAWVTERKNVLSACWYLLAWWSYLRYDDSGGSKRWYALTGVGFAAALLSKSVTCTLPAVLALSLWWRHGRLRQRDLIPLVPLAAIGIAMAVTTTCLEASQVGAQGAGWNFSWAQRGLIAGRAFWFYLGKLLWPARLIHVYPRWSLDPSSAPQWGFPLAAVAVLACLWAVRRRLGLGPFIALLAFAVMLSPALGLVNFYFMAFSFVADHFQYLPSLAVFALGSAVAAAGVNHLPVRARRAAPWVGLLVLAALSLRTWRQGAVYRNSETLWQATLRQNPTCWVAHHELAVALYVQHQLEPAEFHCREALRLNPDSAHAYNNLGKVLAAQGKFGEAANAFAKALAINPDLMPAYRNLDRSLRQQAP